MVWLNQGVNEPTATLPREVLGIRTRTQISDYASMHRDSADGVLSTRGISLGVVGSEWCVVGGRRHRYLQQTQFGWRNLTA